MISEVKDKVDSLKNTGYSAALGAPVMLYELMKLKQPQRKPIYETFLKLGSVSFSVDTIIPSNIDKENSFNWQEIENLSDENIFRYIGETPETLTLTGIIYSQFSGQIGVNNLDTLRQEARGKKPLRLIDSEGKLLGNWYITAISEGKSEFVKNGKAKKVTFTIKLKFSGNSK